MRSTDMQRLIMRQDHVIQRGTMHKWHNASKTEPARLMAVTLPAKPIDIGGKELTEVHLSGKL